MDDNLSKYNDPAQYDALYAHYTDDLVLVEALVGEAPRTLIELACGTGRLAIPLAQKGHTVHGVDLDAGMVRFAQAKAAAQAIPLHLYVQDCTQLHLPIQSDFIYMTGNSFQHFLTNASQDALLASVKRHLLPNGELLFDTRNPVLHELAVVDLFDEDIVQDGETVHVQHHEQYDALTQILHCTSVYTSATRTYEDSIRLRYTYPLELERLLTAHGFDIIALYGSWTKQPLTPTSPSIVVHARLRGDV